MSSVVIYYNNRKEVNQMPEERQYRYFFYSEEQLKEKNQVLYSAGKSFNAGTVIVNGARRKFTQMTNVPELPRFIDAKLVAEGYLDSLVYTQPTTTRRSGN